MFHFLQDSFSLFGRVVDLKRKRIAKFKMLNNMEEH